MSATLRILHLLSLRQDANELRRLRLKCEEMAQAAATGEIQCAAVVVHRGRSTPCEEAPVSGLFAYQTIACLGRWDPVLPWRLLRAIRRLRPDVVHAHDAASYLVALLLQPLGRYRLVATANDEIFPANEQLQWRTAAEQQLLAGFDRVIAANSQLAAQLCRLGCRPNRVDVLLQGIDTQKFDRRAASRDLRDEWQIPVTATVAGVIVANLPDPQAGQSVEELLTMLDASCQQLELILGLPEEANEPVQLLLAGLSKRFGSRLHLRSANEWTPETYATLDWFTVLGTEPSGGRRLLEAQAMEVPCVCDRRHPAARFIIEGTTGRLIDPTDLAGSVSACTSLIWNRGEAESLARAARLRICQRHSRDEASRRVASIYRQVVDQQ